MKLQSPTRQDPTIGQNLFLASLPRHSQASLLPDLQPASLTAGEPLDQSADQSGILFPTDTVISLQHVIESGKCSEIMTVGREGIVGIANGLIDGTSGVQAQVQSAGRALRMRKDLFRRKFEEDMDLRSLTLRYLQSMFSSTAQAAACNRHHTIDQQLCRKLLSTLDQTRGMDVTLTHENIALALGVRREGITQAAAKLRDLSAITYRRGRITVLDRGQLEALSCECYEDLKARNLQLLPDRVSEYAAQGRHSSRR